MNGKNEGNLGANCANAERSLKESSSFSHTEIARQFIEHKTPKPITDIEKNASGTSPVQV